MTKFFKKFNQILLIAIISFISFSSYGESNYYISEQIENIIRKYNPNVKVGVEVASLTNGSTIYQRNADQSFIPASTLKTFTAAAALSYLGPNYRFETKILSSGFKLEQGNLYNNLYIYFDGDPLLKKKNLDSLFSVLEQKGIRNVKGEVYIDDSIFDQAGFGPGWEWDERNYCYAAPSSAITIEKNCFSFAIIPPRQVGKLAGSVKNEGCGSVNLINSIIGRYGSNGDCRIRLSGAENNNYYLTGCMRPNSRPIYMSATIQNPRILAKAVVEDLFRKHHIKFSGEIKFAKTPNEGMIPLAVYNSEPLSVQVRTMLKKSDNIIANALYKKLGYSYFNTVGSWETGASAVRNILKDSGVNFRKVKMVDGSGLSHENFLTPHELTALMKYVYQNPGLRDQFLYSLPIAGVDGHLEHRMADLKGRVIAKTGTEKGIVSLAGYIYADNGQVLVFAININNFYGSVHTYQNLEDKICTVLSRI